MASPAAETKMCIISVEPIPSVIAMPVRSRHARQVASGKCSPAEMQYRRVFKACSKTLSVRHEPVDGLSFFTDAKVEDSASTGSARTDWDSVASIALYAVGAVPRWV